MFESYQALLNMNVQVNPYAAVVNEDILHFEISLFNISVTNSPRQKKFKPARNPRVYQTR